MENKVTKFWNSNQMNIVIGLLILILVVLSMNLCSRFGGMGYRDFGDRSFGGYGQHMMNWNPSNQGNTGRGFGYYRQLQETSTGDTSNNTSSTTISQ